MKKVHAIITIIIENASISKYAHDMPKFWIAQSSDYGRVLNMQALHSVLNMPEYPLPEFWIHLGF